MNQNAKTAVRHARKEIFSNPSYKTLLVGFVIGALGPFTMTSFLLTVALYFPLGFVVETTKAYKRLNK